MLMRTEETTSTTAVTKNGSMENRAVGMFSGIYSLSMLSAPNTSEPRMALYGLQLAKMTNATAIQPWPLTQLYVQVPAQVMSAIYAPPRPHRPPPARMCTYLYKVTLMPAASAAPGFSPTALRFSPLRV